MKDSEKIRILDDGITDLAIVHEKIAVMVDRIDQEYFNLRDDYCKLHYFAEAKIELDIISDYVIRMGNELKKNRRMLQEWKGTNEGKEAQYERIN